MAIEQQTPLKLEVSQFTLSDAFSEFFVYQRTMRHSPRTLEYYEYTLGKLRRWLEERGCHSVCDVDGAMLRRFGLTLAESGLADNTVHNHMRAVRAFYRFLEKDDLIERNPMRNVRMPKVEKKILPAFTEQEISKLLAGCEGGDLRSVRNKFLVMMLLDSGLRLSECVSLKIGDINPETGVVQVMGKGRKERVTRITASSLRVMRKYLRLRSCSETDSLWVGERGAMTNAGIGETLEKLGKKVGVHAHPHKFRRTCAIRLLRHGADVFSVQMLLGHSDLAVLRRYLDQTHEDVLAVHERCSGYQLAKDSVREKGLNQPFASFIHTILSQHYPEDSRHMWISS